MKCPDIAAMSDGRYLGMPKDRTSPECKRRVANEASFVVLSESLRPIPRYCEVVPGVAAA